jgi:hypothetical protein
MMTSYWCKIYLPEELILPAVSAYAHIILSSIIIVLQYREMRVKDFYRGLRKVNRYKPERHLPVKE